MSKQEEIRKGIARIGVGGINPLENARPNRHGYEVADDILAYLHSQGVVLQVEKPLPSIFNVNEDVLSAMEYRKLLDGCGFFEPLIKEE